MKNAATKYGVLLLFLVVSSYGNNNKEKFISQQKKIREEIELTNRLLEKTSSEKKLNINSLNLVQSSIRKREKLIANLNMEINILDSEYRQSQETLKLLEIELEKAKNSYAKAVYESYINYDEYQALMYLLASKSINQLYTRFQYIEQYQFARKKNLILIEAIKLEISRKIKDLERIRSEKVSRRNEVLNEKRNLMREKARKESIVANLKSEEKKLKQQLREKEKLQKQITEKIEEIIREEKERLSNKALTPREQLISGKFETNKGRLPWPTLTGVVTSKFGKGRHAVLRNLEINNIGIDITTEGGTLVRAVYEGNVQSIFTLRGSKYTVIIKHGEYYSVYNNLEKVYVKIGDEISTKESIGELAKSDDSEILRFLICKNKDYLNPEEWLAQ